MKRYAIGLVVALLAMTPAATRADGSWLDQSPPVQWNTPGMAVPVAPAATPDQRCLTTVRPAETDEDDALVQAGWYLVGGYQGGWGEYMAIGASNFDGMCRPLGFQTFVFVDGNFAGTISPVLMDSRTDGVVGQVALGVQDRIAALFSRYADTDPLCCPSRTTAASYHIDRSGELPVLLLDSTSTSPTSPGG
jgi:hypothetical protein